MHFVSLQARCPSLIRTFCLVVRGLLDAATVDACNAAIDAAPESTAVRGPEGRLDGRMLPHYHPSAAQAWGDTPSPALTGDHARGDISCDLTRPPFRDLVAKPAVVRLMLGKPHETSMKQPMERPAVLLSDGSIAFIQA
jgi:hypothetical protein